MNKFKVIAGLLAVFVTVPIWFYLLYQILVAINASELAWFLYWAYLPVLIFVSFIERISAAYD